MNQVYVALGSNMGNSHSIINDAKILIENNGMKILACSKIYKTKPYGYLEQPDFTNGMLHVETELSCNEVLEKLLSIEQELGRVRVIHWGPRIIDLDIIFFNNEIYNEEKLKVPHPDMQNRDFVLGPMCDLNEEFVHPVLGVSMRELLNKLNSNK